MDTNKSNSFVIV